MRVVVLGVLGLWGIAVLLYTGTELKMLIGKIFAPEPNNELAEEMKQAYDEWQVCENQLDYVDKDIEESAMIKAKAAKKKYIELYIRAVELEKRKLAI